MVQRAACLHIFVKWYQPNARLCVTRAYVEGSGQDIDEFTRDTVFDAVYRPGLVEDENQIGSN
jgi:hypothetical protein